MILHIHRVLRLVFGLATGLIFVFHEFVVPLRVMSQNVIDATGYSFTNSPLLIMPKAYRLEDSLHLIARARFMNNCHADTGIDANYVDLTKNDEGMLTDRVFILRQRVRPEGCPDIFAPTVRAVEIISKAANAVRTIYLLDHAALEEKAMLTPPPISLQVFDAAPGDSDSIAISVLADPLGDMRLEIPIISSVKIIGVSGERTLRYTVEITALVQGGQRARKTFSIRRYETRIGDRSPRDSSVIDWLLVLLKSRLPTIGEDEREEEATFQIELEAAGGVPRRVGLINHLTGSTYIDEGSPFSFFEVR